MISQSGNLARAIHDIQEGIRGIHVWPMLGWLEIRQRYRRSILGPFWLTISTGALLAGMGPLYARLFGQDVSAYFPYLAVSWVMWSLISTIITDACAAFISAEGFIKQLKLPLTVHVLRVVWKNLIIFVHNFVIVVIVLIFYRPTISWSILSVIPGVFFIALNGLWIGILLGLVCARFRDIPQIIASLVQVAFFLTPVMWRVEMLGSKKWLADINPLFHFLEILRAPIVTGSVNWISWIAVIGITVLGFALMLLMFSRFRARIAYWI